MINLQEKVFCMAYDFVMSGTIQVVEG
jgi:hypothetical protein